MRVLLEKFSNTGLKHKSFANCERVLHLHMLKLYSRSLPLNKVNAKFFHSTQKKLLAKMWIKLPYGKFPCSFGRVAFVNNKFFITHLWPASKIILFSRNVNYNHFLFLSSYVRWLANNFTPKAQVLLFTAILRNKQARNTRFIKPISVKLTHAQTFFRGVAPWL